MRLISLPAVCLLLLALAGGALVIPPLAAERANLRQEEGQGLVLPSPIYRIIALEFKGILADVIFSKAMTYYGQKVIRDENLTDEEWDWIARNMHAATDLDPYFLDPYLFGAVNLVWEADRVDAANDLLIKGMDKRVWDSTLPFYLGFNHFYFLQKNSKAASFLMEGAKRAGGSGIMAQLATRLLHQERNTENAIIFLRQIISTTEDERTRDIYTIRLTALESIFSLERAVEKFHQQFNRFPSDLGELIEAGIIEDMPGDPYGGRFYLDEEKQVRTTSELRFGGKSS